MLSSSVAYCRRCTRTGSYNCLCILWSVVRGSNVRTLFKNSNDHELCCMLNHESILLALWCCQLLHCDLPKSNAPSAAKLIFLQSKQDSCFNVHHECCNGHTKISQPTCTLLYAINTSLHKQVALLYEYFFIQVLLPREIGLQYAVLLWYSHQVLLPF